VKTLHLAIIIILFASLVIPTVQNAIAMPYMSPQDLYKQSEMVFYGQVISKQSGPSPDYNYYQVKVETYFKNSQTSDSITVAGHKPDNKTGLMSYPQFETGDKAIFYIEKQEGINVISPYSTKAGEGCDIHAFLGPAPIPGEPIIRGPQNPLDRVTDVNMTTHVPFATNQAVLVTYHVWNNFPQSRNVTVELTATNQNDTTTYFYKKQSVKVDACDLNAVNWIFVPTKAGNYIVNATENTQFRAGESFEVVGSGLSVPVNSTYVISPLQQFKSGTPPSDVKCNDGLQLILKGEDGSPACVKPDTAQILIERGWALNYTNMVGKEAISLSAYQGVSNETFYNNGTVASDFTIDVNINNFKSSNTSLVLQVYYNDGILYKTVSVPSGMIQPDGFYKYHLIAISDENHPVPFKVVATYNKETATTYATVFAHP
jgi:hypothetical protein